MYIATDFITIPDIYAKQATDSHRLDGVPITSFPFAVKDIPSQARYFHWAFTDDDAIPVCGFQWIHWGVANVPIEDIRIESEDSRSAVIPENFSQTVEKIIPRVLQGRNSRNSPWVQCDNPQINQRYNGPQPPNEDHWYHLRVWATSKPLEGIRQGFWLNELYAALRQDGATVDEASGGDVTEADILLLGKA